MLVDGELIEQPISGDLQSLSASQFAQQQESLLRLMRERLDLERRELASLQRRAERQRPIAIFMGARAMHLTQWQRLRQRPVKEQLLLCCLALQVALLATQAVGLLVRAAEQPAEGLRLGGILLGCGLLLLGIRMGKPLRGGLTLTLTLTLTQTLTLTLALTLTLTLTLTRRDRHLA